MARTAGEIAPLGDGYERSAPFRSTRTRAEIKAETLAARAAKTLTPAGQQDSAQAARSSAPTLSRAERKARTLADVKSHQLLPAGQG
jgi:hypothetical protein